MEAHMELPLIVGVQHDIYANKLLDRECQKRSQKEVLPFVNESTLLLLEGAYQEAYIGRTGSFSSFFERWKIARQIGMPIGHATIGWRDGRYLIQSADEVCMANLAFIAHAEERIGPCIVLPENTPTSFAALARRARDTQIAYDMVFEEDDRAQLDAYRHIVRSWSLFDHAMITAAREWGESERPAVILCGRIHALSIHRKTAWPVISLAPDTSEAIRELTRNFIATILHPETVVKKYE